MVAVDVRSFCRVVRLLVQPLHAGHLFGFLGDLDAISGQYQTTVYGYRRTALQYDFPPITHNRDQLPGSGPEKRQQRRVQRRLNAKPSYKGADSALVYAHHKAQHHHGKPVEGRPARKAGPESFQDPADVAYHGSSFAKAKVFGAVRTIP